MLYERAKTPWSIEVIEDEVNDASMYEEVFRTTFREEKECEQFTLLLKDSEDALIQLRIFKNGDVTSETWIPTFLRIDRRAKRISVLFIQPIREYVAEREAAERP
jgi:hypothetical protein